MNLTNIGAGAIWMAALVIASPAIASSVVNVKADATITVLNPSDSIMFTAFANDDQLKPSGSEAGPIYDASVSWSQTLTDTTFANSIDLALALPQPGYAFGGFDLGYWGGNFALTNTGADDAVVAVQVDYSLLAEAMGDVLLDGNTLSASAVFGASEVPSGRKNMTTASISNGESRDAASDSSILQVLVEAGQTSMFEFSLGAYAEARVNAPVGVTPPITVVPLPASGAFLVGGLVVFVAHRRRKSDRSSG